MPNIARGTLILLSLALMVFYFVLYPYSKFRKTKDVDLGMPDLKADTTLEFRTDVIYSNGNIFLKTIQFFGLNFSRIMRFTFLASLAYFVLMAFFYMKDSIRAFKLLGLGFEEFILRMITTRFDKFVSLYANVGILFNRREDIIMYLLSSVWMTAIAWFSLSRVKHQLRVDVSQRKLLVNSLVFAFAYNLLQMSDAGWITFVYILASPLVLVLLANTAFNLKNGNVFSGIRGYFLSGVSRMSAVLFMFVMITFFGLIFIISPLSYVILWLMEMNVELSEANYTLVLQSLMMFAFIMLLTFSLVFYFTQCIFLSYSLNEIVHARGLMNGIDNIGKTVKAYGIETE